ncbi:putative sulfate transporter [Anatilimnocola aggregata]|uniref:Putative sulfate transporter n=1 Tax=Anatilimnocola aggregata TaxID=2528021 RepID=A0A517Y943_9BACT|nr:SulP family inorganic anion transporter [Anatilimnocola aggregata]QDU26758.1 putative sulfate transporter [Anatilimnocola aggregata]
MNVRNLLPITDWLPRYDRAWISADLIAGITLAAYAIPVSLAYAALAGLPPQMGLYCYLAGGIGYLVFGSSRHVAIGPTSAISLLLGVSLLELDPSDQQKLAVLASLTAVAMACVFSVAWLLRLSVLVNFISESILTGFKAGAALVIAATQLPKLLGVKGGGDDFFERVWILIQQADATHWLTLAVGVCAIAFLLAGERLLPRRPIALFVVLVSIVAVWFWQLDQRGVKIVGFIPAGLPSFQWRAFDVSQLTLLEGKQIVRLASACFLLSYIESVSAARTFALKHKYDVNPRQELLGLGAASLLAGLFQGYPIAGGLSQSAVNERAGARTQLSLLFASLSIGIVLVFLTAFFRTLPDAVLAAVVLVAVKGLINVPELLHLWRTSRLDFAAASVAFSGVLLMGVLDGVLVAVLASILMLLGRVSRPYIAFLGRIPGTPRFSDLARHSKNEPIQGAIVFRVQSSLLYFNVDHVLEVVRQRAQSTEGLQRVICDLSNVPYVDIAGARMLLRMYDEFDSRGVIFRVVEAHGPVREMLRAEGLEAKSGPITRLESLADLLSEKRPAS